MAEKFHARWFSRQQGSRLIGGLQVRALMWTVYTVKCTWTKYRAPNCFLGLPIDPQKMMTTVSSGINKALKKRIYSAKFWSSLKKELTIGYLTNSKLSAQIKWVKCSLNLWEHSPFLFFCRLITLWCLKKKKVIWVFVSGFCQRAQMCLSL